MKLNNLLMTLLVSATSFNLYARGPIEPIMETIPSGSFEMGSMDRQSTQPIHTVNIKQFSMGKYEVTVKEFRQFIEATNYQAPTECRHELDGWFKLASKGNWETNALNTSEFQPVVCINWKAANAYTQWLAKETGKPYRLPSEAEWEYAARANTTTDYFFGDDKERTQVCKFANTADLFGENILQREVNTTYHNWDTGLQNCVDNSAYASIVGMYQPNPFGLHDVVSNVQEFLADCYVSGYENAPTDGSARLDGDCEQRSVRSGSWHWNNFPTAWRGAMDEEFAGGVDGFRIALDGRAPKNSKATKLFADSLKNAQSQERKRRELIPEFPEVITNLKIEQSDNSVTLTWDKSATDKAESYRVYRNNIQGKMFKLLATNLKQTSFTDASPGQHKYEYSVVAVKNHMQSHYSKPVSTKAGWVSVPGKIEAEWTSEFEGTSISFSSDNERGGYSLTGADGIADNATIKYQIEVAKSGNYQFEYRVASPDDRKGFEVLVNDNKLAQNLVSKTGGYHDWSTQQGEDIYLDKGKHTLTLKSKDSNWKLNWLALKQI